MLQLPGGKQCLPDPGRVRGGGDVEVEGPEGMGVEQTFEEEHGFPRFR